MIYKRHDRHKKQKPFLKIISDFKCLGEEVLHTWTIDNSFYQRQVSAAGKLSLDLGSRQIVDFEV